MCCFKAGLGGSIRHLVGIGVMGVGLSAAGAAEYYVATTGDNTNPGTFAAPFRTIQRAANVAVGGDTIFVRGGTYRETITPVNSGTSAAPITYRNYANEVVVISGADLIDPGSWSVDSGSIYRAALPGNFFVSSTNQSLQVFVDGEMVTLAKWPNTTTKTTAYPGGITPPPDISRPAKSTITSFISKVRDNTARLTTGVVADTALPPKPAGFYDGAQIFFQPNYDGWSWAFSGIVTNVPANGIQITFTSRSDAGKDFSQSVYDSRSRYYLFNKKEFLDAPGEWWHDTTNGQLYLWTPTSASPATQVVEVKKRDYAFNLTNRSHITIQGFVIFGCSITTDTSAGGSALGYDASGNSIYPWRSAGSIAPSTGIVIDGIQARYLNHFTDVSGHFYMQWGLGSGIVLSGTGHTLRNSVIEKTAGNGVAMLGRGHTVFNNTINDTAYSAIDCAAINTVTAVDGNSPNGLSQDHEIAYNTIRRTSRSGITPRTLTNSNAGGGQFKARIHHNDIAQFGLQDWDVGGIYLAGGDGRFARFDHNLISEGVGYISAGIYLDYARNHVIDHNVIWNVEWGIKLQASDNNVNNALVYNNTSSVINTSGYGYGPFAIGNGIGVNTGTVLRNNILSVVTPPAANGYNAISNGTFAAAEIVANLAWDGIANSATDPKFIARATALGAPTADYGIQAGSAAIDTGTILSTYLRDGISIPPFPDFALGNAPDRGAYEYGVPRWRAGADPSRVAEPIMSPWPGSFTAATSVTLRSLTPGAVIRYTTDGSTPTPTTGLVYTGPISLVSPTNLRAIAYAPDLLESEVVAGHYDVVSLQLRGNQNVIPLHDNTPDPADHTDFGGVEANFASITRTFTLTNLSASTVTLNGLAPLSVVGSSAFTIVKQPAPSLAPGASTTFELRFRPTSTGAANATVFIAQADLPGGAFDFVISGQGLAPQPALDITPGSLSLVRPANSVSTAPLVLTNTGRGPLTWSLAEPPASGNFTVYDSSANGPAFAWQDTATGGTSILSNVDDIPSGMIPVGFPFPYLGNTYTSLYISPNGFITLGNTAPASPTEYNNIALPTTRLPANSIALFWDDLVDDASSTITWKQLDAETFGVTYNNLRRSGTSRVTAQILLKADGRVILQYRSNTISSGYTIGYQGSTSSGQTIAHNTSYLGTGATLNRALTLQPPVSWLSGLSLTSGTIPPGGSQTITLSIATAGLAANQTHSTNLFLTTNAPDAPTKLIPVTLSISNLPATPAQLRLGIHSSTEVGLEWADLASNETGYKVERRLEGQSTWTQIALLPADATSYLDSSLPASTVRHYRVSATNASGDSPASAEVTNAPAASATLLAQPFADPTGTAAAALAPVPGILTTSGVGSVQTSATLFGSNFVSSGRGFATENGRFFMVLDPALPAFAPYVADGRIGGSGTGVLYVSWLARGINAQESNAVEFRTGTSADSEIAVSIGTTFGNGFIRAMSASGANSGIVNYVNSSVTPSTGTDLYVAKFTFGPNATTRVDVYVNQPTEGTPTVTTTGYGQFNVIGFAKFGTSAPPALDEFRFASSYAGAVPAPPAFAAPALTALTPTFGPLNGGTTVTLYGSEFSGVTGVIFGGKPATNITVTGETQLTCVAPPHAGGRFHVTLTTLGGSATLEDAFLYQDLTPYQAWLVQNGLPADGNGAGADSADPDSDGVANLLEYALGGNPTSASSGLLPTVSLSAGNRLQISFSRQARPDLTYIVEAGTHASSWPEEISRTTGSQNTGGLQTVSDNVEISSHPRRFLRLRVTRP